MEEILKGQLKKVKDSLNKKQLYFLTEETRKLKEFQETPSTQEELEKIPKDKVREICAQHIEEIKTSNSRDFRF